MKQMSEQIHTMPLECRGGIAGRHIVACGRPAQFQRDALVTGNGKHKLHIFGDPHDETVVLDQEDLYVPCWKTPPTAADCAGVLGEVQRLLLEGNYEEASYRSLYASLANGVSDKHHPARSHPAFVLKMSQAIAGSVRNYIRLADLRNAVVTVRWEDDSGLWKREALVPRLAEDIAYLRITPPKGCADEIRLTIPQTHIDLDGTMPKVAEVGFGEFDWSRATVDKTAFMDKRPEWPETKVTCVPEAMLITGAYEKRFDKGGYAAAILVKQQGGAVRVEGDELILTCGEGAITLLMKAAAFPRQSADDAANLLAELWLADADFDAVAAGNAEIHGAMFGRMELDLGGDDMDHLLTTEELMEKQRLSQGINAAYMEKMVDMGRYFLLYNSGKWPPIYGHVNININHQISCANIASLPEMMDVFMRWIEWQLPDARENARLVFGARGFLIACHPDTESGKLYHFAHLYPHHYWISGSGWCLQPFLEYYYCSGDEEFLKNRLMPLYQELALFYEDYLKLTDENGKWIFAPSYSPENFPSNTLIQTAINATMDITVCREVMDTLLNLGPRVGVGTQQERAVWQNIRDRLPEYLVDTHGELKEWAWPTLQERYDHRHLSHLYGAYPGDEFQPENGEETYRAAFIANRMRAQENSSAHGIVHRAQIAARLKDPYFVFQNTKQILETGFVNESFSTRHNPYVSHEFPDAQGALPTIVLESLLYSQPGVIELLPALPWCWPKGKLKGMIARTATRVDELSWDLSTGEILLELLPLKSQQITLRYRPGFSGVLTEGCRLIDTGDRWCKVELERGQRAVITVRGAPRAQAISL